MFLFHQSSVKTDNKPAPSVSIPVPMFIVGSLVFAGVGIHLTTSLISSLLVTTLFVCPYAGIPLAFVSIGYMIACAKFGGYVGKQITEAYYKKVV